jgi:hypothetical protein
MGIFGRRKEVFETARGIVDGKEITYTFTRAVPKDIAMREFREAAKRGLPSGSVILIP